MDVLSDVLHWHDYLKKVMRRTDEVTGLVLQLVEDRMLQGEEENRISALELCEKLDDIVNASKTNMEKSRKGMPTSIVEILLAVDEEAPVSHSSSSAKQTTLSVKKTSGNRSRLDRKSEWQVEPPVKTPYRTENLKHEMNARRSIDGRLALDLNRISFAMNAGINEPHPLDQRKDTPEHVRHTSSGTILTYFNPNPPRYKPDVFQAREEIESRDGVEHNNLRWLRTKPTKKDVLLSSHFHNRDLVSVFAAHCQAYCLLTSCSGSLWTTSTPWNRTGTVRHIS